jgi:hypothetical protein
MYPQAVWENNENSRAQRKIFGPKRQEVTGEWRKFNNEEPPHLCPSRNIMKLLKSRMRWAGHVARMRGGGGKYKHDIDWETR